jgi:hypothetical protein
MSIDANFMIGFGYGFKLGAITGLAVGACCIVIIIYKSKRQSKDGGK